MTQFTDNNQLQSDKSSGEKTNKAHMLVAMLGHEFTKSADHPFFAKLSSIVAAPDPESTPVPKGALDRLLAALPAGSESAKSSSPTEQLSSNSNEADRAKQRMSTTLKNLGDQHPAVIAHYLVNNAASVRMEVISSLEGSTARQAAVYFTRFLSRLEAKSS